MVDLSLIMYDKQTIMLPGPVTIHPRVLSAMSKPMINHRGEEFGQIYDYCVKNLRDIFRTKNDLFILTGSGTCAMEAALGNLLNGNDKILVITNGKFGERFKELGERYGELVSLEYEWGKSIDLEDVKAKIDEGDVKAVTLVHNETSTGIINPAPEIGKLAKEKGALFIMDGVSSIGGNDVYVDDWDVDIAVFGSQKCLAAPPGLSAISIGKKAWEFIEDCKNRPYYTDLLKYRGSASKKPPQTPYTPAVSLFFALEEAIKIFLEEGIEENIERHRKYSDAIRVAIMEMRLTMFPQLNGHSHYSNTVNAINLPEGIKEAEVKKKMQEKGIIISGGQGRLKDKIFRIGTMGYLSPEDMVNAVSALELVLKDLKYDVDVGRAVEKADDILFGGLQ